LQGSPLKSRHDDESDDRKKFCAATKHGCTLEAAVVDWQAQTGAQTRTIEALARPPVVFCAQRFQLHTRL
jgi:hypothetical protein